jgi:hypothetical protein
MEQQEHRMKKTMMMYFWRVQQSQAVISIVFWGLTITGIFYPFVREKFDNFLLPKEWVFVGMMIMFSIVMVGVILFGIIYDKFKFWKEQQIVIAERNPYASWKLMPLHMGWMYLWVETAKALPNRTPELEDAIRFSEAWIARCKEIDPWTADMTTVIREFALKGDTTAIKQMTEASANE